MEARESMRTRDASQRLQHAARQASVLGQRVTRTSDEPTVHQMVIRSLAHAVHAQFGALALVVPHEGALRIVATVGYPHAIVEHIRLGPGEGMLGSVFASGQPLLVGAGAPLATVPQRRRYRTQSFIVVPLKIDGRVIGVAAVSDPRDGNYFDRLDLRVLSQLLPTATLALERQGLRNEVAAVSQAAIMDPVTGLANRVYLGNPARRRNRAFPSRRAAPRGAARRHRRFQAGQRHLGTPGGRPCAPRGCRAPHRTRADLRCVHPVRRRGVRHRDAGRRRNRGDAGRRAGAAGRGTCVRRCAWGRPGHAERRRRAARACTTPPSASSIGPTRPCSRQRPKGRTPSDRRSVARPAECHRRTPRRPGLPTHWSPAWEKCPARLTVPSNGR